MHGTVKILAAILILSSGVVAAKTKFKVLHNFTGGGDGGNPILLAGLAIDGQRNLHGATYRGGYGGQDCPYGCGVIFEMSPRAGGKWTERVLFEITDPVHQHGFDSPLAVDSQGDLYGCTDGAGPMFELTPGSPQWNFIPIWPQGCDGPVGLLPDGNGNLYGDYVGEFSPGANGWTYTDVYTPCQQSGCPDGDTPLAPFSWDAKGNLYGTTYWGGYDWPKCYCGVAFQMTPNGDGTWTYHVLHRFAYGNDGAYPYGSLTVDASGNAYGTTTHGGPNQTGTVFKLTPTSKGHWKETLIYTFPNGNYGVSPGSNLVFDTSGNLYGIAGSFLYCDGSCGLVFKLTPQKNGTWRYSIVHHFNMTDGDYPNGLTMDGQGNLYGTTTRGGKYGYGVAFELTP